MGRKHRNCFDKVVSKRKDRRIRTELAHLIWGRWKVNIPEVTGLNMHYYVTAYSNNVHLGLANLVKADHVREKMNDFRHHLLINEKRTWCNKGSFFKSIISFSPGAS